MITGISTDYTGRTRDLHILQGSLPLSTGKKNLTFSFGRTSNYCTGIQKLIQRFTIALLTELGSQPNYPGFGSDFALALTGNSRSKLQFQHDFNFAASKILTEFREYQQNNDDMPLDEQLSTVVLTDCKVNGDTVDLEIGITAMSGDDTVLILPLPNSTN